jgi:hypothetical protein
VKELYHLENLGIEGLEALKWVLNGRHGRCEMNSRESEQILVAGVLNTVINFRVP